MPEIEISKDKNPGSNKAPSTSSESEKASAREKPKENPPEKAPQKNVWDLPDGEFSEVIDSEGHRNRINYY